MVKLPVKFIKYPHYAHNLYLNQASNLNDGKLYRKDYNYCLEKQIKIKKEE